MRQLIAIVALVLLRSASAVDTVEFRRALLINASANASASDTIDQFNKSLESMGFLVTLLPKAQENGYSQYNAFIRGIPEQGVSLIYYCGRMGVTADGKETRYEFQLGGYKKVPSAWNPKRRRKLPKPLSPLSLSHLLSIFSSSTARQNHLVIDNLGFDDTAKTGKTLAQMSEEVQKNLRRKLGERGYASYANVQNDSGLLATDLTQLLNENKGRPELKRFFRLPPVKGKEPFLLQHKAGEVCSPPEQIRKGRFAGDHWVDPYGMCFVWCPAATFTMGDAQFDDAQPVEVTISKGYWFGKYELSKGCANLMGLNSGFFSGREPWQPAHGFRIDHVVEAVSTWEEHKKTSGINTPGWIYDAPTEAEWEYACLAGTNSAYPAPAKDLGKYANFADRTLYNTREPVHYVFALQEADDGYAHEFADIGQFRPNPWGFHDMLGNVAELCCTYYSETLPGGVDPIDHYLETTRSRRKAVIRGGAWCSPIEYLHVAHRNAFTGSYTPFSGVRLVIRQGERKSRSSKEIIDAMKAEGKK